MTLSINAAAQSVKTRGFGYLTDNDNRTVYLSGGVTADDVGKAVTIDTTAANTFKLAGDGDEVFGRLEVFEDRVNEGTSVGTVKLRVMGVQVPVKADDPLAPGDYVIGGGSGTVRKFVANDATAGHSRRVYATEVSGGYATVYQL